MGRNLNVTNNLAYAYQPGDGHHRRPGAIRMHHNGAGPQIVVQRNADRGLIEWENSAAGMSRTVVPVSTRLR